MNFKKVHLVIFFYCDKKSAVIKNLIVTGIVTVAHDARCRYVDASSTIQGDGELQITMQGTDAINV